MAVQNLKVLDDLGGRLGVFLASTAALVASSLLAVLVGERLGAWIPLHYLSRALSRAAGVLFVAIGGWLLLRG